MLAEPVPVPVPVPVPREGGAEGVFVGDNEVDDPSEFWF
jgi:hypothetical protein